MSREAFVMAATVGLAARNVAHNPEKFGKAAVDLGLAVAAAGGSGMGAVNDFFNFLCHGEGLSGGMLGGAGG